MLTKKILLSKKNLLLVSLFFVTTFLLHFQHKFSSDEGVIINGAWNIYNGKKLYVDFFEYISPGSFYFVYLIFLLFGPSYTPVKIISVIFLLITALLIYKISRLLELDEKISKITSLLWLIITSAAYPLINHNTYSTFLVIFLSYTFILFIKKRNKNLIFISGILAALTFYFLQTKGFFIIISLILFLLIYLRKDKKTIYYLLYFILGLLTIFIPGYIFWGDIVITAPFLISKNYLEINQTSYVWIILFTFLTVASWWFLKKQKNLNIYIYILLTVQVCLFLSILNLPDIYHIILNAFPLILILSVLLRHNLYKLKLLYYSKIIKAVLLISISILYLVIFSKFLTNLSASLKTKNYFSSLQKTIGQEEIFSHPFMPGLYFELKKENPYYTNVIETIQGNKIFLMKNFEILNKHKPKYILTEYNIALNFGYEKNIIDYYIFNNYRPLKKYQHIILWEKK